MDASYIPIAEARGFTTHWISFLEDFGQIELVDEELFCQLIQCKLLRIMLVQILFYSCQFHSLPAYYHTLRMPGLLHQESQ